MGPWVLLAAYCAAIVAASLAGGILPGRFKLSHVRLQLTMSFVAGLMLGVAVLHLLPHSIAESGSVDRSVGWLLGGLLAMFFMIRLFHSHQHVHTVEEVHDHHHDHAHDHSHAHDHAHENAKPGAGRIAWIGLALGLSLHTLIDGVALAAAVEAERQHAPFAGLAGLGAFLAIVLHKPLDSLAIATVMKAGGWSARATLAVNAGYALMCPLGAVLFSAISDWRADERTFVLGAALAFSAGVFLCIALSDILPEVAFHSHDRAVLSAALLVGVIVAWMVGLLESRHMHAHDPQPSGAVHGHAGDE
jgi:zinc and cadmium transporter